MNKSDERQRNGEVSVNIRSDIAQEIHVIAEKRQMDVEALVNEILERYVIEQDNSPKSDGAAFLLSIAGMFNSGIRDTSETLEAVVTDVILQKHMRSSS